jgi:hypothetical protein
MNKKMPSASQNTDAMTFPADGTYLVFFGGEKQPSVHCFDIKDKQLNVTNSC